MTNQQTTATVIGAHHRDPWAASRQDRLRGSMISTDLWNKTWRQVRQPTSARVYWDIAPMLWRAIL